MANIVVLGAGTGGMPAAYELREKLAREHRITVVNALDHFQFVPSNPFKKGEWVHLAKIGFEKYFMRKMKTGGSEPVYEKYVLELLGIEKLEHQ